MLVQGRGFSVPSSAGRVRKVGRVGDTYSVSSSSPWECVDADRYRSTPDLSWSGTPLGTTGESRIRP